MPQSVNPFATKGSAIPEAKPAGETNADGILDLLNADDKPIKEDKSIRDDADDTDDADDKEEIKLKGEDDELNIEDDEDEDNKKEKKDEDDNEEDDETRIEAPPRIRDIEAKYPRIFKDFPFLSKMMARDKQYTELFGSFDEAKEVAGKVEDLNKFESQLLSGDTREILQTIKNTDTKAFDKIVDNYLSALETVDKDAYFEVCGNFAKRVVMGMVTEAKRSGDEDLHKSAEQFYKYLFGTTQWENPKIRVKEEKTDENKELETERLEFVRERFEVARDDLQARVDNTLKSTINEYIDPKGLMSVYEKKNAVREALDQVHEEIRKDDLYIKNLNKLWRASSIEKFSKSSLDKIRSSYLGRAKSSISSAIKKVRAEALKDKDSSRSSNGREEKEETPRERKNPINAGRPSQQINKAKNARQKGESVEDFFARD